MSVQERQAEVREHCMAELDANKHYPGYPEVRFMGSLEDLSELTIPQGPWSTDEHQPVTADNEVFVEQGLSIDTLGRPLHPWAKEMCASIGLIAGKGAYWNWGPNRTVDPVVITDDDDPHILLVERNDNGKWAFPGGFLDPGETVTIASRRECLEETGVTIDEHPVADVYSGPVADDRTTAHAWAQTDAKLWRPKTKQLVRPQLEEVASAEWLPITDLPNNIHGSHAKIIELALREIE